MRLFIEFLAFQLGTVRLKYLVNIERDETEKML